MSLPITRYGANKSDSTHATDNPTVTTRKVDINRLNPYVNTQSDDPTE
ncbi:hypothetical protein [Schlesneria sp. DSM 10557]